MFQNNQQMFNQQAGNQSNKYQPVGYVQSQYQGIPKSRGGISAQNAGPVISHVGYTAAQSNQNLSQQSRSGMQGSGFGMNASVGPVISRVGYSNGQDFYSKQQQQPQMQASMAQQQPQMQASMAQQQPQMQASMAQQQPQMQASMAQQQQQPIISKFGFTAAQNASRSSAQMGQQSFQASNFSSQAQSQFHPVYQAAGQIQQAGPVISHVGGYTAGGQSQFGQRF
ncbi:hypothetical protein [Paenibacillus spongiae]|uniref:Uncharacterized protein n=1 Tax=Paenibacillus spongiae TaxID=2909671 RepID=A0ABY5S1Y0_9BACL|nr:hypothetical protein [Paenibacillus spongiae]UVI27877.1 hypothetical protein L1F29_20740 [Paenibacillus spongiae]